MKNFKKIAIIAGLSLVILALIVVLILHIKRAGEISESDLIKPKSLTFDHSLDKNNVNKMVLAARLYYTFWNTGEFKYLDAVLAPTFIDHTLKSSYHSGSKSKKDFSIKIRSAIPDLKCSIEELLITGEMITARINFHGTSKFAFMGHSATGKPIEFVAIDILHVQDGKIVEDWHLEDKLALFQQLGLLG